MDRFIPWAVLDMSVGRFGCSCGPFWILPWAVLDISKIYGPFWSGPFWFMGRFGIDPLRGIVYYIVTTGVKPLPDVT